MILTDNPEAVSKNVCCAMLHMFSDEFKLSVVFLSGANITVNLHSEDTL